MLGCEPAPPVEGVDLGTDTATDTDTDTDTGTDTNGHPPHKDDLMSAAQWAAGAAQATIPLWGVDPKTLLSTFATATVGETSPSGVALSSDGTSIYLIGQSTDTVWRFPLSTPWDLSTIGASDQDFSVTAQTSLPGGIAFKPDGTEMYVTGTGVDDVVQYTLSTPWDLTTASLTNTQGVPCDGGLTFSPDGTRMILPNGGVIFSYVLSTPWDVTTAGSQVAGPALSLARGVFVRADGRRLLLTRLSQFVGSYEMTTPWDVTTLTLVDSDAALGLPASGMAAKPDGTRMYFIDQTADTIREYRIGF